MNVLHCIPHVHQGGADLCAIGLVRALNKLSDVEARLCVFQGGSAPEERIRDLQDPLLIDFRGSHIRPDQFLLFRAGLRRVVREWRVDIVHSHLWPACRWSTSALLGVDVRHVWHIHDTRAWLTGKSYRDRVLRAWTRWVLRRAAPQLVSVSRAATLYSAKSLMFDANGCQIISCGVDRQRFKPMVAVPEASKVVGLAAQFRPEKGHELLLRAMKLIKERGVVFELRLAGDGPTSAGMKKLAAELNLERQVHFLGHIDDVPAFLAGLDLFVLPSTDFEGLPVCLLEAMSMRVPVVATAVSGVPEIIEEGITGRLVPPGNVEALADAIAVSLVKETNETAIMVDQAESLVQESYTIDIMAAKAHAVYQHILQLRQHAVAK